MLTTVIALISFAVAFVCGGILSKAYFASRGAPDSVDRSKLHALLHAQQIRYRKRMIALNNVILRHEETRDQVRSKLTDIEFKHAERGQLLNKMKGELEHEKKQNQHLQQQLAEVDTGESNASALEKELGMLHIERDELAARIRRMETEQEQKTPQSSADDDEIARMRADMGALRETLAIRDRRVHDLELQLQDSTERTRLLQAKLDSWKQRVTPLTRKLKQQKEVIRKFCQDNGTEFPAGEPGDDLKAIHGIGPALERRLQKFGIRRYQQLAVMTPDELADMAKKLAIAPNLAERDAWIQQARDLHEQSELCQTA